MTLPATQFHGNTRYFPKETDLVVLRWCSAYGMTLEGLAGKLGIPRVNLSLMLKGVDPVPVALERQLRSLMEKPY